MTQPLDSFLVDKTLWPIDLETAKRQKKEKEEEASGVFQTKETREKKST